MSHSCCGAIPISHSQDPPTDDQRLVDLQVSKPKNEKGVLEQSQTLALQELDISKVNRYALFRETERSASVNGFQRKSLTRDQLQVRENTGSGESGRGYRWHRTHGIRQNDLRCVRSHMGAHRKIAYLCGFLKSRLPMRCNYIRIRSLENDRLWRNGVDLI
jgi:hypothetical protein